VAKFFFNVAKNMYFSVAGWLTDLFTAESFSLFLLGWASTGEGLTWLAD
jgi:hypothetical protein